MNTAQTQLLNRFIHVLLLRVVIPDRTVLPTNQGQQPSWIANPGLFTKIAPLAIRSEE
jgi:hypothetical protein